MNNKLQTERLHEELGQFRSHGLADLSRAGLMDRVDTKYLINAAGLIKLLPELRNLCTVLEMDGRRVMRYENFYYDSSDLLFYHSHHSGRLNRYKVRKRTYADQGSSYLEVKFKNNKARTVKTRIPSGQHPISRDENDFIHACGVPPTGLSERLECHYSRIAFASEETAERLTVDFDIRVKDSISGEHRELTNTVILELKQDGLNRQSDLYRCLKASSLRPSSFSKYCIGMSLVSKRPLKYNRFKPSIRRMEKVSGDDA